jgi:DNA-binding winged helix-turn-helix (wHTH) protein
MEGDTYRFGEFSITPGERRLFQAGKNVPLPPKAFDALYLLVRNDGRLVSRAEVVRTLWPRVHVTEANLTNIIVLLRKVLGRDAIQTVSRFGYRLTLPVTGQPGTKQAAYASFVRGKELLTERSLTSIQRARDLFLFSLAHDPQFATGWAWLGHSCHLLGKFKVGDRNDPDLAEAAFQRAFAIDPDLACGHHFYTELQADSGQASHALTRLASRVEHRGEEPETLAALVQVLRCCGLLDESVAAHERAVALDPTIGTSVAHTLFLQGEYANVFENYTGKKYYLDAAAWAALGEVQRAARLLRTRLCQPELGPLIEGLMTSLLAVLEGRRDEALGVMEGTEVVHEPEVTFHFARHCGMLNASAPAVRMLRRARLGGFWSSRALERDPAFAQIRKQPEFDYELRAARRFEVHSDKVFQQTLGSRLQSKVPGPSALR